MQANLHLKYGARSQNKTASLVVGSSALLPLYPQGCYSFCPPYTGSVLLKGKPILGIPRFRAMHWPYLFLGESPSAWDLARGQGCSTVCPRVAVASSLPVSAALSHQPSSLPSRPLYGMFPALPSSPSRTPPSPLCDLTFTCPPHLQLDVTPLVDEVFSRPSESGWGVPGHWVAFCANPCHCACRSVLPQS